MDKLIKIAINQIDGMQGSKFERNNTIINYAEKAGINWVDNNQTPWCSIFLNWCAQQAGLVGSGKANIRSWLLVGWPTFNPEPGDIVVCWEEHPESDKGYVGIYMGCSKKGRRIYCVGGNKDGSVSLTTRSIENLVGFQRLMYQEEPFMSTGEIKAGDRGPKVKELQSLLKMAGFDCGYTDGIFGQQTAKAVRALKLSCGLEKVTEVFDEAAKECLMVC